MATPDLAALTSAAQIFSGSHTLPQIRAIHKALHAQIDDKAARLRTQVGGSYRELLGTADTIVRMRDDMDTVQATLGRMGGCCGRAVVNAKVAGLARFVGEREDLHLDSGTSLGAVARVRLLDACLLTLARVLRSTPAVHGTKLKDHGTNNNAQVSKGDRLVLAAKLWVLGRLLVKSFGDTAAATKDGYGIDSARKTLENLHARLLRSVDGVLRSASEKKTKQGGLLKALSAYSLANSCGARDVLRHFLHVRSQAIALAFETDSEERGGAAGAARNPREVLRSLGLYTATLQDVQFLVPHKLTDALIALKKTALLDDESLQTIEGLRLDVYKRWCGDEIQFFTPFIRHDDLDGRQAKETLIKWAGEGSNVLLGGLEKTLDGMSEFKAIVDLRTSVLKLWVAEGGKARGFDPSLMLNRIRDAVNAHLLQVLEAKVSKLRLVGSEVSAALDSWREGATDRHQGLWDDGSVDTDLSHGAAQFTQDVIARLYGRNDAVSRALNCYRSWFHVIDDVGQVVDQLRRHRWDNDVDEIEDEDTIEQRQQLLARDDPQTLHDHLDASLARALAALDDQLAALWSKHRGGPNRGPIAVYLLRVLRDIRARLPELDLGTARAFGLAAVPYLHEAVAAAVAAGPVDDFATAALARTTVAGKSLWEGGASSEAESLLLPTSPSPGAFRFLRNLSMAMGDAGGDLWSPAAVAALKRHVRTQLAARWLDAAKGEHDIEAAKDEGGGEGRAKPSQEPSPEQGNAVGTGDGNAALLARRQDLFVQWLFDLCYLGLFLGSSPSASASASTGGGNEFKDLESTVMQGTGLAGGAEVVAARERLAKASQDYWKRTSLLFGLLA
ncbi:hypothetical protein B0T26DRAFT_652984 [Lasiosphaeria miniovina]|uniref:Conserved oligomeric Golgi complex subunit 1 n=1 Tax=Lasiosphaeria miniovina TaxID=1954250 RepID=A0AA40A4L0_9PEZI|nr:uncharacterized protein B0T26DRAFT_652984 [Lasiosphaeria miniovina]KAK0709150.1 hypothetical protein B0T26DRAFT_652984 [Lasiosphaeria miniovina]